ncbi:MAG: NAD-dependent epimerase/dehydratase family protein [Pyrinomonadaceae bacterium]
MKILIIGGTKFLGRHLIGAALENGHQVTIFHRGKHPAGELGEVEEILGDRNTDLEKLAGRGWDVCIDTCGYLPQTVRASAEFLRDAVDAYVFISSISAYADFSRTDYDETAETARLTEEQEEEFAGIDPLGELTGAVLGEMYGALKVLCEEEATRIFGDKVLIIRPGLIVGKFDFTDRFTYWVMRVAAGGEVLAPGNPENFVQFIDARDLARWTIAMAERGETGVFNATGKPFDLTFRGLLDGIKSVSGSDSRFIWADGEFLEKEQVAPWSEMPLYLPETEEFEGFQAANIDRALALGLNFRSLSDTIKETLEWRKVLTDDLKAGISAEREKILREKLRDRK